MATGADQLDPEPFDPQGSRPAGLARETFDVVVVGAGLSGVAAGHHLRQTCPELSFTILEARAAMGGTWDLFRFPGVRSDSDMFTLGYPFRPWRGPRSISSGESILAYIRDTAAETGIDERIRYRHRVTGATWDSSEARWTVEACCEGNPVRFSCSFLYLCCGYFRYDEGHLPVFAGQDLFTGRVVHPQHWPGSLDLADRRVVVIGSGATAVTLVPAIAETAAHVTMLQRSPGYMLSLPSADPLADWARGRIPAGAAYSLVRWKNIVTSLAFYQLCRRAPAAARRRLLETVGRQLPDGYPVEPDFSPRYDPWTERLCVVKDGDLFTAMRRGRVSVVTGWVDAFTENGIRLASGEHLAADVVVLATGLEMLAFGGIPISVDGVTVDPGRTFVYRGFMLGGVPNLAVCIGYTNASWTLRADLVSRRVARLLSHMRRRGWAAARPSRPDPGVAGLPLLDLSAGYVSRAADRMPKRAERGAWKLRQNYLLDYVAFRLSGAGAGLEMSGPPPQVGPEAQTRTSESSVPNSLAT